MWPALGLLGVLALWGALGLVPACAAFAARRGDAPLFVLPLGLLAGVAGGALAPALGAKYALGFGASLLAALAAGAVVSIGTSVASDRRSGSSDPDAETARV